MTAIRETTKSIVFIIHSTQERRINYSEKSLKGICSCRSALTAHHDRKLLKRIYMTFMIPHTRMFSVEIFVQKNILQNILYLAQY